MSNLIQAADTIKRLAFHFQGILEVAEALNEVGSIEQAKNESIAARAAADAERSKAQDELNAAKKAVEVAKAQAKDVASKAYDQAMTKLQEADQKAQAIIDGAKADAEAIVAAAKLEGQGVATQIAGQIADLTSTKLNLEQDIASLNAALEAKRASAEEIEARLAKAQAAVAKLLG